MTVKQFSTATAEQSTDGFPLTVRGPFSRLLPEAKPGDSPHKPPDPYGWEVLEITLLDLQ